MIEKHYHDVRDRKGRFTKLETIDWSMEKQAMVIENETGEEVKVTEEMSNAVAIPGDENVIRGGMQKVTDWMLGYSSFVSKQKEIEQEMSKLTTALENAELRVREAQADRDVHRERAQVCEADARMAREAYGVVAKERDDLGTKVVEVECTNIDLRANLDRVTARIGELSDQVVHANTLLEVAREERDRFREELGATQAQLDDIKLKHNIDMEAAEIVSTNLRKELDGVHHKYNGLEDEHKRVLEELAMARNTLSILKGYLN